MVEPNQSNHPQIVRAIIAMALREARKEIKRNIQREGRIKLCEVPARDIAAMAKAMVEANPAEFIATAKASSLVQDEIQKAFGRRKTDSVSLNEILELSAT